ncbi:MAG TPA: dihydroneopterin aldolase [Candidatus Limnocylindria bacterium]|nr:dihydroneopterin aldolase [Candidatus Limnocylindria bacterium]
MTETERTHLDRIEVRGIHAWGHHGANPGEQVVAQPLDIDVTFELDLRTARASDELADTVSYADVHATVVRIVATERFALLERLGEVLLEALMADPRIVCAAVSIAKPRLLDGATPVVVLRRER